MVAVTENFPSQQGGRSQKIDTISVPSGEDDKWVDAGDWNPIAGSMEALERAVRMQAVIAAIVPGSTTAINGTAFRLTENFTNGLPEISKTLTSDLNKLWAIAVEKIEQGGDVDGTASGASGFFGVANGIVSGTAAQFVTGTLVGLSSDGVLIPFVAGALPPVGIGLASNYAHVDMGGRVQADNVTLEYKGTSGTLGTKAGASTSFGDVYVSGTLTVGGAALLQGAVTADTTYVFNNSGNDNDGQFKGLGNDNLLFLDAGNDRVGIGTNAPGNALHILNAGVAGTPAAGASHYAIVQNSGAGGSSAEIAIYTGNAGIGAITFGDTDAANVGRVGYNHSDNSLAFSVNGVSEKMRIQSDGKVGIGTNAPSEVLEVVGNVKVGTNVIRSVSAGLVASTTQTQGQGPLTKDINEVATVANANDTVTLPTAAAGLSIFIRNNGANILQIFPAASDAINGGAVNASVTLAAGASVTHNAIDATNWYS